MAGLPGACATCPANTVALCWLKIVTPAMPLDPVYSHTIPPPPAACMVGPVSLAPRAASACAMVGQTAAVAVAAVVGEAGAKEVPEDPVAADATVVPEAPVEALLFVLVDPQPARATPITVIPAKQNRRAFMGRSIGTTSRECLEVSVQRRPEPAAGAALQRSLLSAQKYPGTTLTSDPTQTDAI